MPFYRFFYGYIVAFQAKGIMKKAFVASALVFIVVWTTSFGLMACAIPSDQGLDAYYEISLVESAQVQQRVHVRARFAGLEPGPLDFAMLDRWAGYSNLSKQVSWIKIGGSDAAHLDVDQGSAVPMYPIERWRVQVPQNGKFELEYYVELSGHDGVVSSKAWDDHAILLSRSLFIFPGAWLNHLRDPLEGTVGVRVLPPKDWPVYAAWPTSSNGATYLPKNLEDLIDGAIALGSYCGYELVEGQFHLQLLLPSSLKKDFANRRATGLGFSILSIYRFFGTSPSLSDDMDMLVIVVDDGNVQGAAGSTGDTLTNNVLLARTSADLPSTLDGVLQRQAIRLWNGGAIRAAERWSADAMSNEAWMTLGWTDYLAWKIPLEMGKTPPIRYWDHLRHVVRTLESDPALNAISLAQAEGQVQNDPALRQFVRHKGHLVALLLDENLRANSGGECDLVALFCHLLKTRNYYTTGRLVGEKEVVKAIAEMIQCDYADSLDLLLQGVGQLDVSTIPQLSGPPVGETQILPTTDGLQLVYQWVDGPSERTAIYLSGGPGLPPYDWMYWASEPLRSHVDVAYLEQRGCGRSARPGSGAYSLDAYINDVELLREQMGAGKVVLIGHAWGGFCALEYAMRYPERIDALVLVSPIPSFPQMVESALKELAGQVQEGSVVVDLPLDEYLQSGIHSYHDLALLMDALEETGAYGSDLVAVRDTIQAAYAHYMDISLLPEGIPLKNEEILPTLIARDHLLEYDLMKDLQAGDYPILILHGERDRVISQPLLDSLGAIMGSQVVEIPNAGHYVYLDNPSTTVGEILSFLGATPR